MINKQADFDDTNQRPGAKILKNSLKRKVHFLNYIDAIEQNFSVIIGLNFI
jgi:hypothetical protein